MLDTEYGGVQGVWTKRGVGHGVGHGLPCGPPYGLLYGLPVVQLKHNIAKSRTSALT